MEVGSISDNMQTRNVCVICESHAPELHNIECCPSCEYRLTTGHLEDNTQVESAFVDPIIHAELIDEMSAEISKASPESGCIKSKKMKEKQNYYHSMNEWIDRMQDLEKASKEDINSEDDDDNSGCARTATYISFFINICLLVAKAAAVASSSSYTLISSLTDSCMDIIGGITISCIASHTKFVREDLRKYPIGKARVSTVGILVFSILMACSALFVFIDSGKSLINQEKPGSTTMRSLIIMGVTIVVKLTMWIIYKCIGHPLTIALSQDHRNDVITNAFGMFMYWGSTTIAWWLDGAGGCIISLFIITTWVMNIVENAAMLIGKCAPEEVIRSVTYVAAHHNPLIQTIEKIIAFQVGPECIVEIHIVVPGNVPLEVAHLVGETLQLKIEKIEGVERAYVHVDCDTKNDNEHIQFMKVMGLFDRPKEVTNQTSGGEEPQLGDDKSPSAHKKSKKALKAGILDSSA